MSILDELAAHARERVLADSENMSLDILQAMCREKGALLRRAQKR